MGSGAFRDPSAALERARVLDDEVEALRAENAALRSGADETALARELRKALQERDALRRENEDQHLANIAIVQRMKEEKKALEKWYADSVARQKRSFDARLGELEARLDPATRKLDEAYAARDPAANAARLVQVTKERDAFALRIAGETTTEDETNLGAFLKRVIDERDELACEVQHLREALGAVPARSFLRRLFR